MATVLIPAAVNAATGYTAAATATASQLFWAGVATAAGAYIDQTVILPTLFGKKNTGDLGSLKLGGIEEGEAMQYGVGPETRMGGFLAWQPRELIVEEGDTGKGGANAAHTQKFAHGLYIFARIPVQKTSGIVKIARLWFDSKPRYNDDPLDFRNVSTFYRIERYEVWSVPQSGDENGTPHIIAIYMDIIGLNTAAPSFLDFIVGLNATVTGAANSENNGSFRVLSKGDTVEGYPFIRLRNAAVVDANPAHDPNSSIPALVVSQNAPDFDTGLAEGFFFRRGTRTHTIPADIEAEEGLGNVPAFYSFASVLVKKLNLYDFGNRLPNCEGLVVHDADPVPLGEVIRQILNWHMEIPDEMIDTTGIDASITVRGYAWKAPFDGQRVLQPLLLAYDIIWYEAEGMLIFKTRDQLSEYTIPESDLGVYQGSRDNRNPKITVVRETPSRRLAACSVRYIDPDSNYQIGDVEFRRSDLPEGDTETINLDTLTLTAEQARNIAKRIVFVAADARREVEFTVGPKWINLTAGSIVNVTSMDYTWRIMLTEVQRGGDDRMVCRGIEESGLIDEVPAIVSDTSGAAGWQTSSYAAAPTALAILDMPPVRDEDAYGIRVYLGTCASYGGVDWRGAAFYEKGPNEQSFELLASAPQEATIGVLRTEMPLMAAFYEIDADPIDVELYHGSLFNVTEDQQLRGFNLISINGELLSFRSAELISPNPVGSTTGLYRLSGPFLRGLKGTEERIHTHPVGSQLVFIRTQVCYPRDFSPSVLGETYEYKSVSAGGTPEGFDEVAVDIIGRSAQPISPSQISGRTVPDAQNPANKAVVISWNRRTRLAIATLPDGAAPMEEPAELYQLIIYQGVSTSVAQTYNNLTAPTFTYPYSSRFAHGNTGSFRVGVRQLGAVVGNGVEHRETLPNEL